MCTGARDGHDWSSLWRDFGHWGTFDFQRNGDTEVHGFIDAGNYGVCVGLSGAGYTLAGATATMSDTAGSRFTWLRGHPWATVFCGGSLLLVGLGWAAWQILSSLQSCNSHVEQRVPGAGDYEVKIVEETCDCFGGTDTERVVLSSKSRKKEVTLFAYGRKTSDPALHRKDVPPTVTWVNGGRLHIAIDVVSYIRTKVEQSEGIQIDYEIGSVENR